MNTSYIEEKLALIKSEKNDISIYQTRIDETQDAEEKAYYVRQIQFCQKLIRENIQKIQAECTKLLSF